MPTEPMSAVPLPPQHLLPPARRLREPWEDTHWDMPALTLKAVPLEEFAPPAPHAPPAPRGRHRSGPKPRTVRGTSRPVTHQGVYQFWLPWGLIRRVPWLLLPILALQVMLSLRLVWSRTAFGDEALYLWAGHLEWAHWFHGTRIPAFATWFSGAPVLYPPIGALADSINGLAGARILSLIFMLGATAFLWGVCSRLFNRRAALFAVLAWSVMAPTMHLGAFATYDAMALFLIAAATWCATGARDQEDSVGWILSAAVLLALANATKYASALFDPLVIALSVFSAYPIPGGKIAWRRGSLLAACTSGLVAILIHLGGSWYVNGISQTTTGRVNGGSPVLRVLADSWEWTAVIVVLSVAAVAISVLAREKRSVVMLLAVLTLAALLVPAEQARIQTTVSLNKHVDFGAWFTAIAAGYGLSKIASLRRARLIRYLITVVLLLGFIPVVVVSVGQARQMVNWPAAGNLISFIKPLTIRGGHFLAETDDVTEYYLPGTSWRQWSNTFSITEPNGRVLNVNGSPSPYARAIRNHYFSLVILSFTETVIMDQSIERDLKSNSTYHLIAKVRFAGPGSGIYQVWEYKPMKGSRS
jgi:4-amino-4-deoxy-L-arabinose transferase-like glycosyltransferase